MELKQSLSRILHDYLSNKISLKDLDFNFFQMYYNNENKTELSKGEIELFDDIGKSIMRTSENINDLNLKGAYISPTTLKNKIDNFLQINRLCENQE